MSRVVGVKTTHDAAIALIEDGCLIFSIEFEKINGGKRYTNIPSTDAILDVLWRRGVSLSTVDAFVFDGWREGKDKRLPSLSLAPYHERDGGAWYPTDYRVDFKFHHRDAHSYMHTTSHVIGAYVMSPFSKNLQQADVIVFDGFSSMRVYSVDPMRGSVTFMKTLANIDSMIYSLMPYYGAPFADASAPALSFVSMEGWYGKREWPGKLMSWIANGHAIDLLVDDIQTYYHHKVLPITDAARGVREHMIVRFAMARGLDMGVSTADVFASVHEWIQQILVRAVSHDLSPRVIFTGGAGLNIKWNSAMRAAARNAGGDLFVPPVPNDCGNAIGAAAAHCWYTNKKFRTLDWSLYCGPSLTPTDLIDGWSAKHCSIESFGEFLYQHPSTPALLLDGRAEIGPRALGHRSIVMSASLAENKDTLNIIKGREPWRPVAPIVRESDAEKLFTPGTPDEYMIFEHMANYYARKNFPAIVHIDGTARLQTVPESNELLHRLLTSYANAGAGYGILCNTSANRNGYGFFESVKDAMQWGRVSHIWSGDMLYSKDVER